MPIVLVETDTATDHTCGTSAAPCDASLGESGFFGKKGVVGGTAGITEVTLTHAAVADERAAFGIVSESAVPNSASWESGNWVFRFEVTTANMNVEWSQVCAHALLNGACTTNGQAVSATGLAISLGTTGVKSSTQAGSAITPNATDRIKCSFEVTNNTSMTQAWGVKPSQNIDTPVNQGAANLPPGLGPTLAEWIEQMAQATMTRF